MVSGQVVFTGTMVVAFEKIKFVFSLTVDLSGFFFKPHFFLIGLD